MEEYELTSDKPLHVMIGSLDDKTGLHGDKIRYDLETSSISSKGFFLEFSNPERFPFSLSDTIEAWLELEEGNTIYFKCKMAQVVHSTDKAAKKNGSGIAIRISQIEKDTETKLIEFINRKLIEQEAI